MAIKYQDGRTEYQGQVVGFQTEKHFSTPGMGDNSRFAIVFDLNDGFKPVLVSVYHDGLYDIIGEAEVDASPELQKRYDDKIAYDAALLHELKSEAAAEQEARTVRKDKRVRVTGGREAAVGTLGTAFWVGTTQYGSRVGVTTDDGEKFFTNLRNVEVAL